MVQQQVLETLAGVRLEAFVVWEPILALDSEATARSATVWIPDPRVRHYWAPTRDLGTAYQPVLGLVGEPAWDVYLLYPPGTMWNGTPPSPAFFMHQLAGRLPEDRLLDGARLAAEIRGLAE